jgi:hypothetical protein
MPQFGIRQEGFKWFTLFVDD